MENNPLKGSLGKCLPATTDRFGSRLCENALNTSKTERYGRACETS
ncbi:hypothetical protein PS928_06581 [Pseudomonas fluorescens]|uniref:Uncharacterized protein n=1 Tax=Pseudomonas fluorescens TaxID=294 RepID=A0A5E7VU40_PSEFL|nr:hypothetical protein PS928_06581 [Pseudomonas fluorescens]